MLLIHGTENQIVPVEETDQFVGKLKAEGMEDITYQRIEGGKHGVAYEYYRDVTNPAVDVFFRRTLANR